MKDTGSGQFAVIAVAAFILLAIGIVIFLYRQNQTLKDELGKYINTASPEPTASISPTPLSSPQSTESGSLASPTPASSPVITNIKAGQKIESPLTIKGTVPPGWMFEGVFPIKLIDSSGKIISQAQAKENIPGSWQSGLNVGFTATLIFEVESTGSGKIRLENDNPSGLPENNKRFDLNINF